MGKRLSTMIVSQGVGKNPQSVGYSFVFDEAYKLVQRGLDVHVARMDFERDELSYGIRFHGLGDMYDLHLIPFLMKCWRVLPLRSLQMHPRTILGLYRYGLNISRAVTDNNIDIIHAHFAYPEGFAGLLAKRVTGKPLVVTLHGCDILTEPSVNYGDRLDERLNQMIREVLHEADEIITASSATYREALNAGACRGKLHLIHNGVDVARFKPDNERGHVRRKHNLDGKTIIFTLRGHEPKYGIEYLIRAVPIVLKEREDAVFLIGGDGSLRGYHEELARSMGISEHVIFTGRIPQNEVPSYYAACNIFIMPSLQEGFGLVASEAMASGKPVIGTNVGGIVDQITSGVNGILVPPKDPKVIAKEILFLMSHPDLMKKMGLEGRRTVESKFDMNKRIDQIISVYETALS